MDKGKEKVIEDAETHYQMDTYEGGITQTLTFKPEIYEKVMKEKTELTINQIFKTKWFDRNKEIRYVVQKHENAIDITTINGKARINLITNEILKRELGKLSKAEARRYKNVYFGAIEFTIKAYFKKNIDTPIEIYISDDRIQGKILDALITVVRGNLIYQKLKFTVQPDFSISLEDEHKELALTLYYKLQGINMPPGSKVMSIETKMIYALTGNHQVRKQHDMEIIVPKLYQEILEPIEYKENSKITIPEDICMDFENRRLRPSSKLIPLVEGSKLSFQKQIIPMESGIRKLDLVNKPNNRLDNLKIKVTIFSGMIVTEGIAVITTNTSRSFVHISKISEKECITIEPQIYNFPNDDREIIVTKSIVLKFKIKDLEYNINLGVLEYDSPYESLLGNDFLSSIKYKITDEGIEINDQGKIRFINKV